jgi:DNA-directed RNA polymerase specialized sigma24 family protein
MSYFLGMTDKEIAAHLNMVRRTVAYRRASALKALKELWEKEV